MGTLYAVRVAAGWHIAQVNIARALEPLDSPALAEFNVNLDPVNALADAAPGFVWRLQDDSGDATSIRVFDDELIIVNLSVWDSIEALWDFVYSDRHLEVMRRRREWFVRMTAETYLALWWVAAGERPTEWDAKARVEHVREHGPTPHAFTFKRRFSPDALATRP
jgi:Domain of unknown function (DUF3291)